VDRVDRQADAGVVIALYSPPAIVVPRPALDYRFFVGNEFCGPCLPVDYRAMPRAIRALIHPDEVKSWLPEPYRRLSFDMLMSVLVGNLPGLPGVIMAGSAREAWLYTDAEVFTVTAGWNPRDNIVHGVGPGGNGRTAAASELGGGGYGGGGGGGGGYANKQNLAAKFGDIFQASPGTSSGNDTSFGGTDFLLAPSGGDAPALSGGTAAGGNGGAVTDGLGDFVSAGADGQDGAGGPSSLSAGGAGGGAGGPHGDGGTPSIPNGDAGYGGVPSGNLGDPDWNIDSTSFGYANANGHGWNWNGVQAPNAGSGGGGGDTENGTGPGGDGGLYGGGAGGGTYDSGVTAGGTGATGCVLVVNNAST
jgi:hypothetical protein